MRSPDRGRERNTNDRNHLPDERTAAPPLQCLRGIPLGTLIQCPFRPGFRRTVLSRERLSVTGADYSRFANIAFAGSSIPQ